MPQRSLFNRFANVAAHAAGHPAAFVVAALSVVAWAFTKPLFNNADTWQLVINTSTTIVTFLMVFLIQNTQNRDSEAVQIKLDELICATQGANKALLDVEELDSKQLDILRAEYEEKAKAARSELEKRKKS